MGCDGGTIPRRDELVRLKKKPEQKDKEAELQYRWRHCAITQQKLQEPIVICGLGRLYSKQSIIENLLEKDKMPESASHIKSLKDVKDLNLTPNPAFDPTGKKYDTRSSPYICSLIGLEMTGKFRFVALWSCGCAFSERAVKEIKGSVCNNCQKPYSEEDIIILNGNEEDVDLMRVKMDARVARRKNLKKDKKSKATSTVTSESGPTTSSIATSSNNESETNSESVSANKFTKEVRVSSKLIANPMKRKEKNTNYDDPAFKKSKDDYSVAKDPKATDVYKSLFTSHQSEQSQTRAHWVTYNPFYN